MSGRKNRYIGKIMLLILSILLFLAGCAVFAYPYANSFWVEYSMRQDVEQFLSFVYTDPYKEPEDESHVVIQGAEETEPTAPEEYTDLWLAMREYNETLYESGQEGLSNESSYEIPSFTLADYGFESEVFAVLEIPALDLSMPIYLGAMKAHMAAGAAQMSQTSLPIGGNNTNCVIAGHRGWNGAAYFLYIPNLQKGDIVTITNPWETLTYEVVDWKIITPYDVESIHIQPNHDMITLLTCHPPATGGRERYLVFCERVQTELEVP